ncbi:MAG: polysaccharide biosynthesis protein [bacterium]|nr:polysaccharide biosynthesis protein [bacterium]
MFTQYRKYLKGKTILITGGTGSFGNTVVKVLLTMKPRKIIIFSRDEKKQHDMRILYNSPLLKFIIGDVRNRDSVDNAMRGVDYVFHAAALKQVPSCEFFPLEAVRTNILGANNVIESAVAQNVERVVVLSTDKAVYPINAMGMSKALMEKTMVAKAREVLSIRGIRTVLCGVRYGNVMYSRGSVIPHFVGLMERGKKLTVTDYGMTRFLLPLSDAVELVLYALTNGKNGEIYVKKAPAATMETLATALCELFSYTKGIAQVGIRTGEKMHETLITVEELLRAKDLGSYYKVPPETQGLDYNQYFFGKNKKKQTRIAYTSENTKRLTVKETITLLRTLPEIREMLDKNKNAKTK